MSTRVDIAYAALAGLTAPLWAAGMIRSGKWRTDWRGRFGHVAPAPADGDPRVLFHGVSVGEIAGARPLVERVEEAIPGAAAVVAATTDTGIARARSLYGARRVVRYPLDFSWMVQRFLDRTRPDLVALVELEVWPNFSEACVRRGIPLCIVNGRLSRSSYRGYRRIRPLVRPVFERLSAVGAQTEEYAERFVALGADPARITVTDTLKWDAAPTAPPPDAAELGRALGIDPDRPLIVAGSTGRGEEAALLRRRPPGAQLLLVPRHPERFDAVARLDPSMVRRTARASAGNGAGGAGAAGPGPGSAGLEPGAVEPTGSDTFLLDTMGELTKAYALADIVVVGRSFGRDRGGSDPMEPAALGKPVVIGPHHEHFADVVRALEEDDAIVVADDPASTAGRLLAEPDRAAGLGDRARQVVDRHRGATDRTLDMLGTALKLPAALNRLSAGDGAD